MLRILTAIVVGTISYLLVGWLVFEKVLGEYTAANTTNLPGFKKDPSPSGFWLLLLSCFSYATLVTLVLGYWKKVNSSMEGLKIGAIISTLVAVMTDSYWYGTSYFYDTPMPMLADILAATVTVGVMGWVIAVCLSLRVRCWEITSNR